MNLALQAHLECLSNGQEFRDVLSRQFLPNLLKALYRLGVVKALATAEANFGPDSDDRRMDAAFQQLFYFFLN